MDSMILLQNCRLINADTSYVYNNATQSLSPFGVKVIDYCKNDAWTLMLERIMEEAKKLKKVANGFTQFNQRELIPNGHDTVAIAARIAPPLMQLGSLVGCACGPQLKVKFENAPRSENFCLAQPFIAAGNGGLMEWNSNSSVEKIRSSAANRFCHATSVALSLISLKECTLKNWIWCVGGLAVSNGLSNACAYHMSPPPEKVLSVKGIALDALKNSCHFTKSVGLVFSVVQGLLTRNWKWFGGVVGGIVLHPLCSMLPEE